MTYSLKSEDLERIRRSIVLLAPRQPAGLDREAAVAVLDELQRLQSKDRRVQELLDQVSALLQAARAEE
ncbi:MAG TPA: hypothetical protein VGV86_04415 [Acidimicrobiales bacterium]|nr:hypothetical protein [Acidimicrobiales bacterium]